MVVLIRRASARELPVALGVMSEALGIPIRRPSVHTLVFGSPDGHLLVAEDGGRVVGTAAAVAALDGAALALRPPWPALPILARSPDAGEALLRALAEPGLRLAAPAANRRAVAVMSELGAERAGVLRMRRGPAVAWRPAELWGVFSLFFG